MSSLSQQPETPTKLLDHDDSAVIKHMEMLQDIITRMADNSAACKRWVILLVAAALTLSVRSQQFSLVWVVYAPIMVFYILDAYYLMLENRFRESFQKDAKKIAQGQFSLSDLYNITVQGDQRLLWEKALKSPATWPVYTMLLCIPVVFQLLI